MAQEIEADDRDGKHARTRGRWSRRVAVLACRHRGRGRAAAASRSHRASPSGSTDEAQAAGLRAADGVRTLIGRPRGPGPERHREPAPRRRARRQGRRGDAARSAAHRAVVGAVPPLGRRLRPLQRRDRGGRDLAAPRRLRRPRPDPRGAPGPPDVVRPGAARRAGVRRRRGAGRARRTDGLAGAGGHAAAGRRACSRGSPSAPGRRWPSPTAAACWSPRPATRPTPGTASARSSRPSELRRPGSAATARAAVATLPCGRAAHAGGVSAPPSTPGGLPLPWPVLAILAIGLALAVGAYLLSRRPLRTTRPRRRGARAPAGDRAPSSAATRWSIASAWAGWPRSTRRSPPAKGASAARW